MQWALAVWVISYIAIGLGIGAAGTSFLALLASVTGARKGAAATLAWLMLIAGAIFASIGTGIALEPYSPARLVSVVAVVVSIALVLCVLATWRVEGSAIVTPPTQDAPLMQALRTTWADPMARRFTGFVFLSILAFYLSELIFEPFAGHIHGLSPEDSTKLSGGKDGAALLGMIGAGLLSHFRLGSLRFWAVTGCVISALGLLGLGAQLPLMPSTVALGLGNGLFVVGAVGSMMQLAAAHAKATGTRMGVFGAAQAIAAGLAGLIATGTLDLARLVLPDATAYATVFTLEAALFLAAAVVAARVMQSDDYSDATLVPGRVKAMYDVVVVGGGPCGATAAEDLVRSGHKVALLDREGRIKPCGGAIPPRLMQDFNITEDQLLTKVTTARMISPTGRSVDIPIENGYVGMVDRKDFDPFLRARAAEAGAVYFTGTFVRIERPNGTPVVIYRDKATQEER
ncbi:MAG: PucC family protein, partial [Pseudomonadota bacterium]